MANKLCFQGGQVLEKVCRLNIPLKHPAKSLQLRNPLPLALSSRFPTDLLGSRKEKRIPGNIYVSNTPKQIISNSICLLTMTRK